jgi:hypothetical protein
MNISETERDLNVVLTLTECEHLYQRTRRAILLKVWRAERDCNEVFARKAGNTWLVHLRGLIAAYGEPFGERIEG